MVPLQVTNEREGAESFYLLHTEMPDLLCPLCTSACDDATVVEVLTRQCPWVLEQLCAALHRHFADPLVQLAWVQLWEVRHHRANIDTMSTACSCGGPVAQALTPPSSSVLP